MNPCIKTGAKVWIESHNAIANGDLYRVGNVWLYVHIDEDAWNYQPTFQEIAFAHAKFLNGRVQRIQQYENLPLEHWFANQKIIALACEYVETSL